MPAIDPSASNKARRKYRLIALVGILVTVCLLLPRIPGRTSTVIAQEKTLSEKELAARRARIRDYFQKRLQRLKIVATTVTPSGQTLDWIPPASQTADGKLASPPPPLEEPTPGSDRTEMVQTEVEVYPHTRGPAGTVPIVRFDVERYLAVTPVPPADPKDVVRSMYPPRPETNGNYYVSWNQPVTNYGSGGILSVWDVGGPSGSEASIAQVNVHGGSSAANPPTLQTIEAGKIEKEPVTGDQRPHFFVYYTTINYANAGDWEGGYNTYVSGYIQYTGSRAPNMYLLTPSVQGGRQAELYTTIHYYQGNWWISMGRTWIGYYPHCKGGMAPPCSSYPDPDDPTVLLPGATLFAATGLRDSASGVAWYGEVHNPSMPTSTDMGSGVFASASPQDFMPAYFRWMFYWPDVRSETTYRWFNSGSLRVTDANCYSGSGPHFTTPNMDFPPVYWLNYFFYGGPGREAQACR